MGGAQGRARPVGLLPAVSGCWRESVPHARLACAAACGGACHSMDQLVGCTASKHWLPQPDADTTNLPVSPCSASAPRRIVDPVALQTTHCIELDDNEAALRWAGIACHTCKAAFKAWCQAGLSHWRPCCHAP